MNAPASKCLRIATQDSITALRQGSPPGMRRREHQALHRFRMAQGHLLSDQSPHAIVRRDGPDSPPGPPASRATSSAISAVVNGAIRPVALPRVPRVEAQGAKSAGEMALEPTERAMIPAQPAQEDERIALISHFLVVKRDGLVRRSWAWIDRVRGQGRHKEAWTTRRMILLFISVRRIPALKRPKSIGSWAKIGIGPDCGAGVPPAQVARQAGRPHHKGPDGQAGRPHHKGPARQAGRPHHKGPARQAGRPHQKGSTPFLCNLPILAHVPTFSWSVRFACRIDVAWESP